MSYAGAIQGPSPFQGYQLTIYEWVLFGVATPLVGTRLYVQFRFRLRPWREVFIILAWLIYLANTICNTLVSHYHWFEPSDEHFYLASNPYAVSVLKVNFITLLTFKVSIYMCKFALLFFYLDLTPRRTCTVTWWAIVITIFWCVLGAVAQIFFAFFLCVPLQSFWSVEAYFCSDVAWFYISSWSLFLFTDVLVYIIPFFILHNLRYLDIRQKRAAYWMFAAGWINIASACLMLACYIVPGFQHSDQSSSPAHKTSTLSAVYDFVMPFQQGTSIIIVCLPQVRRFILGMSEEKLRRQMERKLSLGLKPEDVDVEQQASSRGIRPCSGLSEATAVEVFDGVDSENAVPASQERSGSKIDDQLDDGDDITPTPSSTA